MTIFFIVRTKRCDDTLLFLALLFVVNSFCIAQWSSDPTVNTSVCTVAGQYPAMTSDGNCGAIIAWQDGRNGTYDIYAQRINDSGVVLWEYNGIAICTSAYDQSGPVVTSDGAGGAIIAWKDSRNVSGDNDNYDVYAQYVNAAGVLQWATDGVAICTEKHDQGVTNIISDGAGGAIIVWEDGRRDTNLFEQPYTFDIYLQHINSAGTKLWASNGILVGTDVDILVLFGVLPDNIGGTYITWADYLGKIYAQRIDSSGIAQWDSGGVELCSVGGRFPDITKDKTGGVIITWRVAGNPTASDIYVQKIDSNGVIQWSPNGVPVCTAIHYQSFPKISSDGAGGAIITWEDERNNVDNLYDIYAQRVNASGVTQWITNGVAICTAANSQSRPKIVSDGIGGAIITWTDRRNGAHIYAQRVNNSGDIQWQLDGIPISIAEPAQVYPAMIEDGSGGAIITWQDARHGGSDIYAQNVTIDGNLGFLKTFNYVEQDRWNMVSVPLIVNDYNKSSLFPTAQSSAFAYEGTYSIQEVLTNGVGYWLKFNGEQSIRMTGFTISSDTITVYEGWNMIGSISSSLDVTQITSNPSGFVTSQFIGYNNGYCESSTIEPGKAYWVKVSQEGQLILSSEANTQTSRTKIIIVPTSDLPPSSPKFATSNLKPETFNLCQNYPNPFNPSTMFGYQLPVSGKIIMKVFNVIGEEVATLVNETKEAGQYTISWNAEGKPSGIYFCRYYVIGEFGKELYTETRKILLMR